MLKCIPAGTLTRPLLYRHRFRAAFLACRRHRIDLNILYDHNPAAFEQQLASFISQIKDVDYLNLFLSGLKEEDVTATMYQPLDEPAPQKS
jgi:elongator complex protein 1